VTEMCLPKRGKSTLLELRIGDGVCANLVDDIHGSEVLRRFIRLAMCLFNLNNTEVG
jgi:hypothetical protein